MPLKWGCWVFRLASLLLCLFLAFFLIRFVLIARVGKFWLIPQEQFQMANMTTVTTPAVNGSLMVSFYILLLSVDIQFSYWHHRKHILFVSVCQTYKFAYTRSVLYVFHTREKAVFQCFYTSWILKRYNIFLLYWGFYYIIN